jgi:hypothetical protein
MEIRSPWWTTSHNLTFGGTYITFDALSLTGCIIAYYRVFRRAHSMKMISAKLSEDDDRKLREICQALHIDKSEAIRRATQQLWLGLQIGVPFLERAGGRPKYLLNSGNPNASSRESRKTQIADHLEERARKRKSINPPPHSDKQ